MVREWITFMFIQDAVTHCEVSERNRLNGLHVATFYSYVSIEFSNNNKIMPLSYSYLQRSADDIRHRNPRATDVSRRHYVLLLSMLSHLPTPETIP